MRRQHRRTETPWLVGFTCYLWNIERTLWIAARAETAATQASASSQSGPEITADNAWVLETPDYDFATIGEEEQTFAQLLLDLLDDDLPPVAIPGLFVPAAGLPRYHPSRQPARRSPLSDLNVLSSPYLEGILDVADEEMLLLETSRGCKYRCKFCYYWKSYDAVYHLSNDNVRASLRHAVERRPHEVIPARPDAEPAEGLRGPSCGFLPEGNPGRRFTYFGELRGEGVTEESARLLREANFTEVEVGLQSVEPETMTLDGPQE